ncbi:MAG: hypothetical protein ABIY55_15540 [Kofleriaceae bacterium]
MVLQIAAMSAGTKQSSGTWNVSLHVIMWTTMTVGFIMIWVVLLMH